MVKYPVSPVWVLQKGIKKVNTKKLHLVFWGNFKRVLSFWVARKFHFLKYKNFFSWQNFLFLWAWDEKFHFPKYRKLSRVSVSQYINNLCVDSVSGNIRKDMNFVNAIAGRFRCRMFFFFHCGYFYFFHCGLKTWPSQPYILLLMEE